jgi:hypothetical protein
MLRRSFRITSIRARRSIFLLHCRPADNLASIVAGLNSFHVYNDLAHRMAFI